MVPRPNREYSDIITDSLVMKINSRTIDLGSKMISLYLFSAYSDIYIYICMHVWYNQWGHDEAWQSQMGMFFFSKL